MRLLREEDVIKAVDKHTLESGVLDNDISCILEEIQEAEKHMSALEVLEWLENNASNEDVIATVFDNGYAFPLLLRVFTPYEIVYRIEKYEAEKNELVRNTDEFKVGDVVRHKVSKEIWRVTNLLSHGYVRCMNKRNNIHSFNSDELEHAEPPKEEKQKIRKALGFWDGFDKKIGNDAIKKINELVDAVNEMRDI